LIIPYTNLIRKGGPRERNSGPVAEPRAEQVGRQSREVGKDQKTTPGRMRRASEGGEQQQHQQRFVADRREAPPRGQSHRETGETTETESR
jgi:hypothetical protein